MIPELQVAGTVDLRVDGVEATLSGRGPALVIRSGQPAAVIEALGPAAGGIDEIGSALNAAGLRAVLTGPRGDIITLGAGVHSVLGRLLAGSFRARLGRPAAVIPIAQARLRRGASSRNAVVAAAIVAGIVIGRARRTR